MRNIAESLPEARRRRSIEPGLDELRPRHRLPRSARPGEITFVMHSGDDPTKTPQGDDLILRAPTREPDARFAAAVHTGWRDLLAGRTVSDEELGRRLDARFGSAADME